MMTRATGQASKAGDEEEAAVAMGHASHAQYVEDVAWARSGHPTLLLAHADGLVNWPKRRARPHGP